MVAVLSFGVNSLAIATPNDPSLDRNMPLRVWQPDAVTASPLQGNREKKSPSRPSLQLAQNTTVIPVQPRTYPEQETPQDIEIVVPLNENGRYLGDIATKISGDTPFIRLSDVARLVEPLAAPSTIERLIAADPGVPVSLDALLVEGIEASWDPGQLAINILLPVSDRQNREIEIAELDREQVGRFARPAGFSSFLNLRTTTDYVHEGPGETGLDDPRLNGIWGGRTLGVAYETSFDYDTGGGGFRRNSTRFIYDNEGHLIRAEIGDIVPPTRSFQASPRMAGITVYKATRTLQPYTNTRPVGFQSFSLNERSEVQVLINGRQVRRLTLEPGNYDLTNFPFVDGENNVQLIVEDAFGNRDLVEFDTFFDRSIFRPGYSEWGASFGIRSGFGERAPEYYEDEYVGSAFYRRGFEGGLTAGWNAQFDNQSSLVGAEVLKATNFGVLSADLAVSSQDNHGEGYALDIDFTRSPAFAPGEDRVNWGISGRATSEKFSPVGLASLNDNAYEARAFLSRSFARSLSTISANASYIWSRNNLRDRWLARLSFGQRLSRSVSLTTDISAQNSRFGDDYGVRLQLTYRPSFDSNASASYDSRLDRASARYQRRGESSLGAWSTGVDVDRTPDASNVNASGFLIGTRGDLSLNHRSNLDSEFSNVSTQVTSIRTANSIGFADGAFAFGRPVTGAFAIVDGHKTLRGSRVGVRSGVVGTSLMGSRWLGNPIVSDLPVYSKRNVEFDVEDLPVGYDLGSGSVDIRAPFYAGYRLTVGSDLNTTVIATALDADGEPVSFIAGEVTSPDYPDLEPIEMFTNGEGRFGAPGLGPGRWMIRLETKPDTTIIWFTIGEDDETLLRLGDLQGEFE